MKRNSVLILVLFCIILLSNSFAGTWTYHVHDHLGSTRLLMDENGDTKATYDYYPFGMVMTSNTSGTDNRYKFTGKERDDEGGLNWDYFGARYYDPSLARFTTVDPFADKYPGISPYAYTLNNPLIYTDPTGALVQFSDSTSAAQAASYLNQVNGSDISIASVGDGSGKWQLSTANSTFDFGENIYTSALYDVINVEDLTFNVEFVSGDSKKGGHFKINDAGGGRVGEYRNDGADIYFMNNVSRTGEPVGVVMMHELVAHCHPAGSPDILSGVL